MSYDSTEDTKNHIHNVQNLLGQIALQIAYRAQEHDASKLREPEKSMYDEFTPRLRGMTYGSEEYKQCLKDMGIALENHYAENSHHPEHYIHGVDDMDLLDVIEMLADWVAASRRHADGSVRDSLLINKKRFKISDQLYKIICNTALRMDWIPSLPAESFLSKFKRNK